MLVLSRKIGEELMVGDDVVITLLGIQGKQARIGITAPKYISVHRKEIYLKIKESDEIEDEKKVANG